MQRDHDFPALRAGKGVLQRIRQDLVHHQPARHRCVDAEKRFISFDTKSDRLWVGAERLEQQVAEGANVFGEVDARQIRRLIELLVHERHRADAVLRAREDLARRWIFDGARLQSQKARRDLQIVLHAMVDLAEQRLLLPQLRLNQLLGTAAIGDVANDAHHEHALIGVERTETDLDRELRAVALAPGERTSRAHRARARIGEIRTAIVDVRFAKSFRHEPFERRADQLFARVSEHPLRLRVDDDDFAGAVDDDDAVWRRFEQSAKTLLRAALRRHVADDADDERAVRSLDRTQTDLNREFRAVAAPAAEVASESHRTRTGSVGVAATVLLVRRAIALGNEKLDGTAEELFA